MPNKLVKHTRKKGSLCKCKYRKVKDKCMLFEVVVYLKACTPIQEALS